MHTEDLIAALIAALIQSIETNGFTLPGPTDHRAAEHGEPPWVCRARGAIAGASHAKLSVADLLDNLQRCRELLCSLSITYQGTMYTDDQDKIANVNRLAMSAIMKAKTGETL